MKQEVIDFYNDVYGDKGLSKLVNAGIRRGNDPETTKRAASSLYKQHQDKPFTSYTQLGHLIHAVARGMQTGKIETQRKRIDNIDKRLIAMENRRWLQRLKRTLQQVHSSLQADTSSVLYW